MSKLSNVKGRINYITSHARQENLYATYQTADSAFWSALAKEAQNEFKRSNVEGKCILAVKKEEIQEKTSESIKQNGWLPKLFRSIVGKAKELLRDMIRTQQLPPKPVLSIDMDEYTCFS